MQQKQNFLFLSSFFLIIENQGIQEFLLLLLNTFPSPLKSGKAWNVIIFLTLSALPECNAFFDKR